MPYTKYAHAVGRVLHCVIFLIAIVGFGGPALAATVTWTGATSTNWQTPTNWSPNRVPGASDDVVIPTGAAGVVISSADVVVQSLTLGRALNVASGRTLTVTTATLQGVISVSTNATLSGGTYTIGPGGNLAFPSNCNFGRLSGLTINGSISINGMNVRWDNVTLSGTLTATGTLTSRVAFEGNQTLTSAIVSNISSNGLSIEQATAGTLTIASTGSIRGGNITFGTGCAGVPSVVVNNGTVEATVAGRSITFATSGTLINNGTINGTMGTVAINAAFSPLVGTLVGANINLGGMIDLGGNTWNVSSRTYRLGFGSTIQNGTVTISSPGGLIFPQSCGRTMLRNLTFNGNLNLNFGGVGWSNLTLNGVVNVTGSSNLIVFEGNNTLSTNINVDPASGGLGISQATPGTLTIAPGATILGGNITFGTSCVPGNLTVVNNGTIFSATANRPITFSSAVTLTNNGTLTATLGPLVIGGPFTNNSPMIVGIGGLSTANLVNNSTITAAAGASITINGDLTNNGTLNGSAGSFVILRAFDPFAGTIIGPNFTFGGLIDLNGRTWDLSGKAYVLQEGCTVQNGTLQISGSVGLVFPGFCFRVTLASLTINGDITLVDSGFFWNNVTVNGTIRASGLLAMIAFQGDNTLTTPVISDCTDSGLSLSQDTTGTLTIAAGTVVQGGNIRFTQSCRAAVGRVINEGVINSNRAGRSITFGSDVTLINNGSLIAGSGGLAVEGPFTNNSPMTVGVGGLTTAALTNNSTITAAGGGVTIGGPLVNNGTLNGTTGTVNINGAFNPLLNGTLTGNNIAFGGIVDLAGGVWNFGSQNFRLSARGSIQNGTLSFGTGRLLFPTPCNYGRLSDVTIDGDLNLSNSGVRWNRVAVNGAINVTGARSVISFEGDNTLSASVNVNVNTTDGVLGLEQSTTGTLTIGPSAVIQGGSIYFGMSCDFNFVGTLLVNNGVINSNITGRSVTINVFLTNNGTISATAGTVTTGTSVTNNGIMTASGSGSITMGTGASLVNNGTINAATGAVTINCNLNPRIGTFTGSNFTFGGFLDLGGGTWDLTNRTFRLSYYGTVQNGTLLLGPGSSLLLPGQCAQAAFRNLTINGDLILNNSGISWSNVTHNGVIRVTGAGSSITFAGDNTFAARVEVSATGSGLVFEQSTAGTLTLAPTTVILGGNITFGRVCLSDPGMAVVNNGTINASIAGRTIGFNANVPLTNNGTIHAGPGNVTAGGNLTNYTAASGLLSGGIWRASGVGRLQLSSPTGMAFRNIAAGTLVRLDGPFASMVNNNFGSVLAGVATLAGQMQISSRAHALAPVGGVLTNSGTLSLDRAPLTLTGGYVQTVTGTLALGVGGTAIAQYGRLAISGNATLAGAFAAQPAVEFVPAPGDVFDAVTAAAVAGVFNHRTGGGGYYPVSDYTTTLARFSFLACPTILSPLSDVVVCPLGAATFTTNVFGAAPLSYAWQRETPGGWVPLADGVLAGVGTISGSLTDTLVVALPEVTGLRVRYMVSNICGSATSNAGTLIIAVRCSIADVVGTSGGGVSCNDGVVDGADFIAFINSFSSGDVNVDAVADVAGAGIDGLEPDGIINGGDFIAFINAFAAGC